MGSSGSFTNSTYALRPIRQVWSVRGRPDVRAALDFRILFIEWKTRRVLACTTDIAVAED